MRCLVTNLVTRTIRKIKREERTIVLNWTQYLQYFALLLIRFTVLFTYKFLTN